MSSHTFQLRIKAVQVAPPPNTPPCPLHGTSLGGGSKFLGSPSGGAGAVVD